MIFNLSLPTLEENVLEVSQFIIWSLCTVRSGSSSLSFGSVNYESAKPLGCLF